MHREHRIRTHRSTQSVIIISKNNTSLSNLHLRMCVCACPSHDDFMSHHKLFTGAPHSVELLQGPNVLGRIVSSVRLSQKMLDEKLLRVFLQAEHILAQTPCVHTPEHHLSELLRQIKLLQNPQQNRAVKLSAVVSHQKGSVEGFEKCNKSGECLSVQRGLHGFPVEV